MGLRYGSILSPILITLVLGEVIKEARKEAKPYEIGGYWKITKAGVTELCYDITEI